MTAMTAALRALQEFLPRNSPKAIPPFRKTAMTTTTAKTVLGPQDWPDRDRDRDNRHDRHDRGLTLTYSL